MKKRGFLFPGQGSQAVGMGRDFYLSSAFAQKIFAKADESLGFKISQLCFDGPDERLQLTQYTQPALLTVSYIAYALLEREPAIAAGHSLGEYTALVAAGSLRFEDAVLLVHKRGKYMQEAVPVGKGAMAALLGLSIEQIREVLDSIESGVAEIANWNSREQIVIAGEKTAVERAVSLMDPPRAVFLPVSAPFHSSLMKRAEERLSHDLDRTEFQDLKFPVITNVDARLIDRGSDARDALKRQVSRPVLWFESMELMASENVDCYVELGPGKVLSGLMKRIARDWDSSPHVVNAEDMQGLDRVKEMLNTEL
jgi:[acyl-carrier-protein] S-malonyltransferase